LNTCGCLHFSRLALYFYFGASPTPFGRVQVPHDLGLTTGFEWAQALVEGSRCADNPLQHHSIRYGDTRRIANASPHIGPSSTRRDFHPLHRYRQGLAIYFETDLAAVNHGTDGGARCAKAPPGVTRVGVSAGRLPTAPGASTASCRLFRRELAVRYRDMCRYVLYGGIEPAGTRSESSRAAQG